MFKEKKIEPEVRLIRIRISDIEKNNSFEHMVFTKSWKTNFLHIDLINFHNSNSGKTHKLCPTGKPTVFV